MNEREHEHLRSGVCRIDPDETAADRQSRNEGSLVDTMTAARDDAAVYSAWHAARVPREANPNRESFQ